MNLKRTTLTFLAIIVASSSFLFGTKAKADSYLEAADFVGLPEENQVTEGYLNALSTGFRVNLELTSNYKPDLIELYIDECREPLDSEAYDNSSNYILSSGTSSTSEMRSIFEDCSLEAEGNHVVSVIGKSEGLPDSLIWQYGFVSDFTGLEGSFSAVNVSGKDKLKVGDQLQINYTTSDTDILKLEGTLYGRELTWMKYADLFSTRYTVQEGDPDLSGSIILNQVRAFDRALNLTEYEPLILPIDFSVDANSPELEIISPKNIGYNTGNISLDYEASNFDEIEIFLNGKLTSVRDFTDLTEGKYLLKVVARDLAGNFTERTVEFNIDRTAPSGLLISPSNEITEGEKLVINGTTEPGALVRIEIDGNTKDKYADSSGNFSFQIEGLTARNHEIYLTFIDKLLNENKILALVIHVKEKIVLPVEEDISPDVDENIEIAQADIEADDMSDVEVGLFEDLPEIAEEILDDGFLSEAGEISSRNPYQAWLILGIIIIFSVFLSAISYNFYGKLMTEKALGEGSTGREFIDEQVILEEEVTSIEIQEKTDISESKPEETKETLRW